MCLSTHTYTYIVHTVSLTMCANVTAHSSGLFTKSPQGTDVNLPHTRCATLSKKFASSSPSSSILLVLVAVGAVVVGVGVAAAVASWGRSEARGTQSASQATPRPPDVGCFVGVVEGG